MLHRLMHAKTTGMLATCSTVKRLKEIFPSGMPNMDDETK